jgi:hypothetical protein
MCRLDWLWLVPSCTEAAAHSSEVVAPRNPISNYSTVVTWPSAADPISLLDRHVYCSSFKPEQVVSASHLPFEASKLRS